mmetsp:Transcript_33906/g.39284  ORF Transcript_33906/g.39284 Transcript_33906/m.39284 type:complete len:98 (+) Transcript_33906:57-350(+)
MVRKQKKMDLSPTQPYCAGKKNETVLGQFSMPCVTAYPILFPPPSLKKSVKWLESGKNMAARSKSNKHLTNAQDLVCRSCENIERGRRDANSPYQYD